MTDINAAAPSIGEILERLERLEHGLAALADASMLCGAVAGVRNSALLVEFVNEHRERAAGEYEVRLAEYRENEMARRQSRQPATVHP